MSDDALGGLFGDLFKMLGQQGPDAWYDSARTLALNVATADGDPNPSPIERQRIEQFAPLVARHISALFNVNTNEKVDAVSRSALALAALEQWKPLVTPMLNAPESELTAELAEAGETFGKLAAAIGPLFTGFQLGSVAGHFCERAWSLSAIVLPRDSSRQFLVADNVRHFADEWTLDADTTTIFALAEEMTATLVLSQPGTSDALRALVLEAVRDAVAAQGDVMTRLSQMVDPSELTNIFSNPEALLDHVGVPDETDATRAVNAATAVLRSVFDAVAFSVTTQMVGPVASLREAYRRHRMADARGEDAASALFGIDAHGTHLGAAEDFVRTIVDAHGLEAFAPLLRADGLPTWSELRDPAAWFERVSNSPLA